ncbi:DUF2779 domain-containing protein [Ureaplasma miroungigenitalium]|uniref:DUF2779 domain-containing protein n=1 Tax=Ureaplasma miroungigenitalium TaxID=1042321 RepID=A0ABT3BMH4_9BACT|nr:DUF2779 domain-containing protein [Ureaplasma miroungigenitalium]MCV3728286.1 DUF2779 domain-containing protein [Ureaplasma miroungigenitalium]
MKQSPYISKYDYIGYYTKQKNMWFFSNQEIKAQIQLQTKLAKTKIQPGYFTDLVDDEDEDEAEEFDSYDYYQEYKEFLDQNANLDTNDPKISEGIILDYKSQEHVKNTFAHISNVIDCDVTFKKLSMPERYTKTQEFLNSDEDFILFQPVFITGNKITKPDALVREGDELHIIETKGTSSVKLRHILDLYYQYEVIGKNPDVLNRFACHFYLCIVKYERLDVIDQVSFIISPYYVHQKNGLSYDNEKIRNFLSDEQADYYKRNLKQGRYIKLDAQGSLIEEFVNDFSGLLWDDLLDPDFLANQEELISLITTDPNLKNYLNARYGLEPFFEKINQIFLEFDRVITELEEHKAYLLAKQKNSPTNIIPEPFIPSNNDKGFFKDNDFFLDLRTLYQYENYQLCKFSGYVFPHAIFKYGNINHHNDLQQAFQQVKRQSQYDLYAKNQIIINQANVQSLLAKLKPNKVYFDFESINTAIRVYDQTYAFTQIITQNSVIVRHESDDLEQLNCTNLMCDPLKIDRQWFKDVVDSLYYGDDYSYVVYNKSFEQTRLKEMQTYINEPEYTKKITCIIRNLFDLADFFTVRNLEKINILIPDLCGFYSIKKILPLVAKYYPDFFHKTKCYDYKTLAIGNGLECQIKTAKRVFKTLDDEQWNEFMKEAKIYCENDVRAMIAVELYALQILKNQNIL